MLVVRKVKENSIGEEIDILPGDRLVSINGHPVRDIIDYQFYSTCRKCDCIFLKGTKTKRIRLSQKKGQNLGLEFEPMCFRKCKNNCIFCFIDQNPKDVRPSLKFKDEDYRLSFLYGNYVTLTHAMQKDLDRIVKQRLSPLYVSIHATDPTVRRTLLGLRKDDLLLEKIRYLTEHRIELHGQIVLCPGFNDGKILEESLETCSSFFPALRSMAIVPVGLTKHRRGLTELRGYNSKSAEIVVKKINLLEKMYKQKLGEPFVYLSDEFYLLSGEPLPPKDHYGDYWQVENGVGQTRAFLTAFEETRILPSKQCKQSKQILLITGVMADQILRTHIVPKLNRIKNLHADVLSVSNTFFGESVTVSGLLTGRDIIRSVKKRKGDFEICLPPNCLNFDGFLIDDLTPKDISDSLNRRIKVIDQFEDLWED